MSTPETGGHPDCCTEYAQASRLSRRRFMAGMAATGAAAVGSTMFGDAFRQTSYAAGTTGGNVLVVISLRGGIDGLGMVVPHGDPAYYTARRSIAVPAAQLIAKDPMFGLHPGLAPLQWLWEGGELAAVHATGLKVPNRSHFSAMEEVEDADTGSVTRRGWVNRMIGLDGRDDPSEAIHLSSSIVPTMMAGPAPALAAEGLDEISLVGDDPDEWGRRRRTGLEMTWAGGAGNRIFDAYRAATRTVDLLAPAAATTYTPAVTYPRAWPATDLSDALKDTARLIKADVGTDVVAIDAGSWDLHANYGTVSGGLMTYNIDGLAQSLAAFLDDLGEARKRVTVVTISEFGRRVAENGSKGFDHGWGNMMLVAGAGVNGGQYYGRWPTLDAAALAEGDLKVTTDYRNVLGEIVSRRFPERSVSRLFPDISYSPLNFMKATA
jgi:uncharacterized protein (DUF1501 family)